MHPTAKLCGIGLVLGLCAALLMKNMLQGDPVDFHRHKALLIGIDGVQYEQLEQAINTRQAPVIAQLHPRMGYTGGIVGTSTEQATISGPGWISVLTGTWVDRHRIAANDSSLRSKADSLFKLISLSAPTRHTASIVSWNPINDNFADDISAGFIELGVKCGGDDQCVVDRTVQELKSGNFDFIFAHLDQPDTAGHENGFGAVYQRAIADADVQVGQILAALAERKRAFPDESWLVMLVTDHGRRLPDGYDHGTQTPSEKTVFFALDAPANEELAEPVSHPENPALGGLYGLASAVDVTPTILVHLGVNTDPEHHAIDGVPLIGKLGVRQLSATLDKSKRSVALRWKVTAGSNQAVRVYRDGQLLAKLTDSSDEYTDNSLPPPTGALNYTVMLNGVAVSRLVNDTASQR